MKNRNNLRKAFEFTGFTLPVVIVILLFVEIPFFMSVLYSFTKWNGLDRMPKFIGLENYKELLFNDKDMMHALVFTLAFTVLMVIFTNLIALLLAAVLDSEIKGRNALRAAFYVPNIISLIVIGYVWKFIFSNGFDSFYNLTHMGIFSLSWLGDTKIVFFSVLTVTVWQAIGFYLIIYIAGLQTVSRDLIEAALIDGANRVTRFFKITLPLIMPSITVCVFYSLSNALKTFDVIFSLTFGGPGLASTSIALDIYKTAFISSRFGYGSAKSVVLFILIMIITVTQVTIFKRREVES